jgi:hypothetical protein
MGERAELGIDGNCGFALLGADLQEGEAEFVKIEPVTVPPEIAATRHEQFTNEERLRREHSARLRAAKAALEKLRLRLGRPELSYYFGRSHPYGD